jgi:hypothetical protein
MLSLVSLAVAFAGCRPCYVHTSRSSLLVARIFPTEESAVVTDSRSSAPLQKHVRAPALDGHDQQPHAFPALDNHDQQLVTELGLSIAVACSLLVVLSMSGPAYAVDTTAAVASAASAAAPAAAAAGAASPTALSDILAKAGKRALGGGVGGAAAGVAQVLTLMWLRTAMNYQYAADEKMSTLEALKRVYAEGGGSFKGGVTRLYRGLPFALLQTPLSRFGDTAANSGVLLLLSDPSFLGGAAAGLPVAARTAIASGTASLWRMGLTPLDTLKSTLQVRGETAYELLLSKLKAEGPGVLFQGAFASAGASFVGSYPWFLTYNTLDERLPPAPEGDVPLKLLRSALLGLGASCVSDCTSNSLRVLKTKRQTSAETVSYLDAAKQVRKHALPTPFAKQATDALCFSPALVPQHLPKDSATPQSSFLFTRLSGDRDGWPRRALPAGSGHAAHRERAASHLVHGGVEADRGEAHKGRPARIVMKIVGHSHGMEWRYFRLDSPACACAGAMWLLPPSLLAACLRLAGALMCLLHLVPCTACMLSGLLRLRLPCALRPALVPLGDTIRVDFSRDDGETA